MSTTSKKILLFFGLLVAFFVAYSIYDYFNFSYQSTDPSTSQVANWTPFLKIKFNQNLSSSDLSVKMSPNDFYGKGYSVSGDELILSLGVPMQTGTTYKISVDKIKDSHGQTISNLNFSFTPVAKNISQLPESQQEALVGRNESSPVYKDPILSHLPYQSLDFSLAATFPTGKNNLPSLVLIADIFVPMADTGSLQQEVINQYQQEVVNYIVSLGLNPKSYTIDYVIKNQ